MTCAAIMNGCESHLVLKIPRGVDVTCLDLENGEDLRVARLLAANGWRRDHGRWVCGRHPSLPPDHAAALADEITP